MRSGASAAATARWRPLPDFLVIGAQKAGTTALYAYLRWHPAITGPSWKEVSFFDRHWWRGERVVSRPVPAALGGAARRRGESELPVPPARARAGAVAAPGREARRAAPRPRRARVLAVPARGRARPRAALVRGRAGRRRRSGRGARSSACVADPRAFSRDWWDHTYAARGLYAEQLERWLAVFPRDQLLVVTTDELGERPAETYAVDPLVPRRRAPHARRLPARLRPRLRAHAAGDARSAGRALRRAKPQARGAARTRVRLVLRAWPKRVSRQRSRPEGGFAAREAKSGWLCRAAEEGARGGTRGSPALYAGAQRLMSLSVAKRSISAARRRRSRAARARGRWPRAARRCSRRRASTSCGGRAASTRAPSPPASARAARRSRGAPRSSRSSGR